MIRRKKLRIVCICDRCGTVREDQAGQRAKWKQYKDVWKDAVAEGWTAKAKPDGRDFEHFCKDCSA